MKTTVALLTLLLSALQTGTVTVTMNGVTSGSVTISMNGTTQTIPFPAPTPPPTPPPVPTGVIGPGCTTAYHIDWDCDNYGVGPCRRF